MARKTGAPFSRADYRLSDVPGHLMRRIQQRAFEMFVEEVGEDGPTPRQFAALVTVWQNPGINQTGLVNLTGIDRSTVGEVLGRLVRRGWLRRRRTTTDARSNALYVTVAGNRLLKRVVPKVDSAQQRILAPIPPDRREEFVSNLRLIAYAAAVDGTGTKTDLE